MCSYGIKAVVEHRAITFRIVEHFCRSHDEVKCLYDVIQERENEKKKRVKENLKEFVEEVGS